MHAILMESIASRCIVLRLAALKHIMCRRILAGHQLKDFAVRRHSCSGFPRALIDLKEALAAACSALPPENPGSKWPKTTLGALNNGARLTPEQLAQLNTICK